MSPISCSIRSADPEDLPTILTIYNDAILHTTAVYDYQPHTLEMRQQWYATKQNHGLPVLVADVNGQVVGFSALGPFRAWAAYKYTVENSIYVAANWRRRGIGRRLLAPLIKHAEQMHIHTILAGIDADNAASRYLHQQFGFVEVAHLRQVGYKFGRWLDLVFLQLILETPTHPQEG